MSRTRAHGNSIDGGSRDIGGNLGFNDASVSDNPTTNDRRADERSCKNEVIDLTYSYIAKEEKDWFGKPISIVQPRLEGLVPNDSGDNSFLLAMSRYVLAMVSVDIDILLAENMTSAVGLKRGHFQQLVQKQKEVARVMAEHASWAESHRACVDNFGFIYVVENDPMNPYLGKLELGFLIDMLEASRKHCAWENAVIQISRLYPLKRPISVHKVLEILTAALETAGRDQKRLLGLLEESSWKHSSLKEWLPHTVCRMFGQEVEDGSVSGEWTLQGIDGDVYKITKLLIDIQGMSLKTSDIPKMLKYVHPFNRLIPSISLQQEDIESEIEYLRKKAQYMAIKIESPEPD
ncbi:hypothetical protein CI102_12487 [Trichoderma harzianum]|uniref:Uncharacterized protein n=1 Tax=Trichoderma harzianum CBS 226.95 TaxID=983964 RepID=A0A2T4A2M0_TRIHA|nr:hypothetical protein M431DRAFT_8526 [Trichoderma harzianum CBS 226.95]PKK43745.1 hypothetical protein CI102_12487 [Trichoderma harzianum]PTB51306.1 hypothetical protein M431DRAFT_8526 [Trichoderma harzianum CBS 226.95]